MPVGGESAALALTALPQLRLARKMGSCAPHGGEQCLLLRGPERRKHSSDLPSNYIISAHFSSANQDSSRCLGHDVLVIAVGVSWRLGLCSLTSPLPSLSPAPALQNLAPLRLTWGGSFILPTRPTRPTLPPFLSFHPSPGTTARGLGLYERAFPAHLRFASQEGLKSLEGNNSTPLCCTQYQQPSENKCSTS